MVTKRRLFRRFPSSFAFQRPGQFGIPKVFKFLFL